MDLRNIDFAAVLKQHTKGSIPGNINCGQFFDHMSTLVGLLDPQLEPGSNNLSLSNKPSVLVNKTGVFHSNPDRQLIYLQFKSFYIQCIDLLPGRFANPLFTDIIHNLYHYRKELKQYPDALEQCQAIKHYLNLLYGMVDTRDYLMYRSNVHGSTFKNDIIKIANNIIYDSVCMQDWLYIDVDYAILFVDDVDVFRQQMIARYPSFSWEIELLNHVAIVSPKRVLAIDFGDKFMHLG